MIKRITDTYTKIHLPEILGFLFFACLFLKVDIVLAQQVSAKIDSSTIKIGEQIKYQIEVNSNPEDLVVFPEGETFSPLELVESLEPDTIRNNGKYRLLKEYFLTQFDSGKYVIPSQEVLIRNN